MDVRQWLQKNENTIQKHWLKGVQRLALPHYAHLPDDELFAEILPFYHYLTAAIAQNAPQFLRQLKDWVLDQRLEHGCTLTELLKISFQLRTALGLALLESSDAWRAMATWQQLFPFFDDAATVLAEFFTQDVEETLLERLTEAEMWTASLAQATAETDWALLQLQTVYEVSRDLGATLDAEQIAPAGWKVQHRFDICFPLDKAANSPRAHAHARHGAVRHVDHIRAGFSQQACTCQQFVCR